VSIDFPTLFLNWYKKHLRFSFRTDFDTAIYVMANGHCESKKCQKIFCTTSLSAYVRFVTLFLLLKRTRQSTRSGVRGARCVRPWLTRENVWTGSFRRERARFRGDRRLPYMNGPPSTPGYLLALLRNSFAVSAGPHINYRVEAGTKSLFQGVQVHPQASPRFT